MNIDPLVPPPDFSKKLLSFLPNVIFDSVPLGLSFGQVVTDVSVWKKGLNTNTSQNPFVENSNSQTPSSSNQIKQFVKGDTVSVSFLAGHPRNWNLDQLVLFKIIFRKQ